MKDEAADVDIHGDGCGKGCITVSISCYLPQRVVIQQMMVTSAALLQWQSFTLTAAVKTLSGGSHVVLLHPCHSYAKTNIYIHPTFGKRQRNTNVVS